MICCSGNHLPHCDTEYWSLLRCYALLPTWRALQDQGQSQQLGRTVITEVSLGCHRSWATRTGINLLILCKPADCFHPKTLEPPEVISHRFLQFSQEQHTHPMWKTNKQKRIETGHMPMLTDVSDWWRRLEVTWDSLKICFFLLMIFKVPCCRNKKRCYKMFQGLANVLFNIIGHITLWLGDRQTSTMN